MAFMRSGVVQEIYIPWLVTHCIRTFLGGRMSPGPIPCRNIRILGHVVLVLGMQMSDQTARAQELPSRAVVSCSGYRPPDPACVYPDGGTLCRVRQRCAMCDGPDTQEPRFDR